MKRISRRDFLGTAGSLALAAAADPAGAAMGPNDKPVQTVTAGVPFGRPYNSPFSVR